ncbi:putative pumilio homolog 7, chloroplastic [Primulina eburnea]|uniref:putative pumilio homolog 7, chloroplastic n=1 Tax=Primulina eburnea TaxID=1245227 RepID=UPI003C6C8A06
MATNLHGSLLLRELLDSKVFLLESRPSILPKLIADVHQLSHHPYGCVVLEGVIRIGMQDVQRDIVAQLRGDFALMSMHKDAHIVVLALIMESKEELAPQIYNEMASSPYFSRVLQDPFGKRVIKRAWTCTKKTSHEILPFPDLHECLAQKEKIEDPCMIREKYGFIYVQKPCLFVFVFLLCLIFIFFVF